MEKRWWLPIAVLLLTSAIPGCRDGYRTSSSEPTVRDPVMAATAGSPSPAFISPVQDSRPFESVTESPTLYDPDKATDVRGTIEAIKSVKPSPKGANFLQLRLKTQKGPLTVHLAPQWYLEEQSNRLELKKGALVQVHGSPNVVDGKEVFIAAEIARPDRDQRLRLRHKDGTPVWNASEKAS